MWAIVILPGKIVPDDHDPLHVDAGWDPMFGVIGLAIWWIASFRLSLVTTHHRIVLSGRCVSRFGDA